MLTVEVFAHDVIHGHQLSPKGNRDFSQSNLVILGRRWSHSSESVAEAAGRPITTLYRCPELRLKTTTAVKRIFSTTEPAEVAALPFRNTQD